MRRRLVVRGRFRPEGFQTLSTSSSPTPAGRRGPLREDGAGAMGREGVQPAGSMEGDGRRRPCRRCSRPPLAPHPLLPALFEGAALLRAARGLGQGSDMVSPEARVRFDGRDLWSCSPRPKRAAPEKRLARRGRAGPARRRRRGSRRSLPRRRPPPRAELDACLKAVPPLSPLHGVALRGSRPREDDGARRQGKPGNPAGRSRCATSGARHRTSGEAEDVEQAEILAELDEEGDRDRRGRRRRGRSGWSRARRAR